MKKIIFGVIFCSLVFLFKGLSQADPRGERGISFNNDREDRKENEHKGKKWDLSPQPPVVIKMPRHDVPRPDEIRNPRNVVRDKWKAAWPDRDEREITIEKRPSIV